MHACVVLFVTKHYMCILCVECNSNGCVVGVRYASVAEHFPVKRLELWARDGVHLSDTAGMEILVDLIWAAAYQQLSKEVKAEACRKAVPMGGRSASTAAVKERPVPRNEHGVVVRTSNVEEWTVVQPRKKYKPDMVLQDCAVVLNPIHFSWKMLEEMDKVAPADLSGSTAEMVCGTEQV